MKPLKILNVVNSPRGDTTSDWAAYMRRIDALANGLRDRGCVVDYVHLPDLGLPRPTILKPLAGKKLRELASGYDCIYAANAVPSAVACAAKRGTDIKVVYDVHGDCAAENWLMWQHTRKRSYIDQALQMPIMDWIARRHADGIVVVSNPSRERYIRLGIATDNMLLARNGVDLERFSVIPLSDDQCVRVCYSGAFNAWQGIDNLVAACRILRQWGWPERLKLRLIGLTAQEDELRRQLQELLGEKIEAIDRVRFDQVHGLFRDVHFFVIPRKAHPALRVAMPTKFAEYLSCGRPVVVTDVDETADLVRNNSCGIVADTNPAALAGALEQAAATSYAEIIEMGRRARRLAEQEFSWENITRDYYGFIEKVVRAKP